jgi:hypothetical protein
VKKALLFIIGAGILAFAFLWFSPKSNQGPRPVILARVEFTPSSVIVTNLNAHEWVNPALLLDAKRPVHAIPYLRLAGYHWPAGLRLELPLDTFGGLPDHKPIAPPFETFREVGISADGFSQTAFP